MPGDDYSSRSKQQDYLFCVIFFTKKQKVRVTVVSLGRQLNNGENECHCLYRKSCEMSTRDVLKVNCPNNVSLSTFIHPRFFSLIHQVLVLFLLSKCNFPCKSCLAFSVKFVYMYVITSITFRPLHFLVRVLDS